jgi:hypothetical protein
MSSLEPRRPLCGVPEVKYIDEMLVFADLVVDQNGAVQELANARTPSNDIAHPRKATQQLHVVE